MSGLAYGAGAGSPRKATRLHGWAAMPRPGSLLLISRSPNPVKRKVFPERSLGLTCLSYH